MEEAEKLDASEGFYSGFAVEETPGPYHAPLVDANAGFSDLREGLEAFPECWMHKEEPAKVYTLAEADAMTGEFTMNFTPPSARTILIPKTRARGTPRIRAHAGTFPKVIDLTKVESSGICSTGNGKFSLHLFDLHISDALLAKKRNAPDSSEDDELKYLFTKKVRTSLPHEQRDDVQSIQGPPTYSLITIPDAKSVEQGLEECETINATSSEEPVVLSTGILTGYPGQFCGQRTNKQAKRGMSNTPSLWLYTNLSMDAVFSKIPTTKKCNLTMGDQLHPNYTYTHTNFHACPDRDRLDYSHSTAPIDSEVGRCIAFASEMSLLAAETPRTAAEEEFRREIHRECASARLEGVSVGQYRYYQGHLTIEDYIQAGVCVCWELCECSKLCTRFGDLICRCTKDIKLDEHKAWTEQDEM